VLAAAGVAAGCGHHAAAPANATVSPPYQHFRSRPDLKPPPVTILRRAPGTAPGYVFLAPKKKVAQSGPLILDGRGRVVWFHPLGGRGVTDFRAQRYRGRTVLTWWQGRSKGGHGQGTYMMFDSSYRQLREVQAGNGLVGDIHEFQITHRNTALITVYRRLPRDLTAYGGPKHGYLLEGIVQELAIPSGRVLFEWHSLPKVALSESYLRVPAGGNGTPGAPYDYFHINSATLDSDGNYLISARHTHAVYKLRRKDGAILWRLGGKRSDFTVAPAARFAWQHDVHRQRDGTITLFDNGANEPGRGRSRALVLHVDAARRRVTLARSFAHPTRLLSTSQGDAQVLPNGNVFVGWGSNPYFTEYARNGRVLFDGRFLKGADSYRAYRLPWAGHPVDRPAVAVAGGTAYVSWNGATAVARWQVVTGASASALRPAGTVAKGGFETAIRLRGAGGYVAVRALAADGRLLGASRVVRVG
jgi:hypothetical protein